jgi:hypothetical protein
MFVANRHQLVTAIAQTSLTRNLWQRRVRGGRWPHLIRNKRDR